MLTASGKQDLCLTEICNMFTLDVGERMYNTSEIGDHLRKLSLLMRLRWVWTIYRITTFLDRTISAFLKETCLSIKYHFKYSFKYDLQCQWQLTHATDCTWMQWRAEVCWCPGRLLDWMPPHQILVLSSGVWWSLLLDIRCYNVTIWRHIHVCKPTFWRSLLTHVYSRTPEQRQGEQ